MLPPSPTPVAKPIGPLTSSARGIFHRRLPERWMAVASLLVAVPLILTTTVGSLRWVGAPFPGFFVMANGLVPSVGLAGWSGFAAGVPFHARVISVDGHPFTGQAQVYGAAAQRPVGSPIRYGLEKDGVRFERDVPTMPFGTADYVPTLGLMIAFGTISILAAVLVIALQPHQPAAHAFLIQGLLVGAYALTGTALYDPALEPLSRSHHVVQALFPASLIHLGLMFPVTRQFVERRPAWLLLPYAVGVGICVWVLATFYADPPQTLPLHASYVWAAASIGTLIATVAYAYWENRAPQVRQQLRVVLPGLVVGTTVGFFGYVDNAHAGGHFPINLVALLPLFFYLSVGYAIARLDLFDVDVVLRNTIVYVALTVLIMGAYALAVTVAGALAGQNAAQSSPYVHLPVVVAIALAFEPMRRRVQRAVDRTFFRSRPDYPAIVRQVSRALTSVHDLDRIIAQVEESASRSLHLVSFSVVLWLEDGTRVWRFENDRGAGAPAARGPDLTALRHVLASARAPYRLPDPALGPSSEPPAGSLDAAAHAEGATLGAVLIVPITAADRLLGAFALGPRLSGLPLSARDVELVTTLAAQSSTAIQGALLAMANDRLKAAQLQLVQTDHLASLGLLVAGVAHEINNPVTFIKGNVRPVQEELAIILERARIHGDAVLDESASAVHRMLDLMREGAERTASIVNDLRTFSRVGRSSIHPTDLNEGLDVTLRLLRPKWNGRIEIHRDFGPLPLVPVVPGQINQVFMNLLDNACEAIADQGNIWVHTRVEDSVVRIVIRDDGSGIRPEDLPRIFDPFFTTKPQGKGTGLGLAISHGIVEDHRGSIAVVSRPGAGTTMTVTLPVQPTGDTDR